MLSPADRLKNLPPYVFSVISDNIRAMQLKGIDVIRLDIGNPDLPPPDFVVDALSNSAHKPDHHGYAGYRGTPDFRKAVARYYQKRFGVTVDADKEVLPVIGSKEGIVNLSMAYLDRGDVMLVPEIGYPAYAMAARLAGAEIYWVKMPAENGFLLNFEDIPQDILNRAKLLWINYPNNPTGAIADEAFLKKTIDFCKANNILLASDNPYVEITFDNYAAPSILQFDGAKDIAVEFMSFSKTYNMAGWRLGAALGNAEAISNLLHIKSNIDSGHFRAIYDAGIQAVDNTTESWLQERNDVYKHRRDLIMDALDDIGLEATKPLATLYVWAKVKEGNDFTYAQEALEKAHVSIAPGSAYGPGGENYVRLSVSVPDERLEEGLNRLRNWQNK